MVHWLLSETGLLSIQVGDLRLCDGVPVINQTPLFKGQFKHSLASPGLLQYHATDFQMGTVQINIIPADMGLAVQMRMKDLTDRFQLDTFGIQFQRIENLRAYLRSGYHSWDGSSYVHPGNIPAEWKDRTSLETGYAFTQLLPQIGEQAAMLGFDRHDRYQTTFTWDTLGSNDALTILTHWEGKSVPEQGAFSESLYIFDCQEYEEGLRQWSRIVASATNPPPRLKADPISGWCSWYNLYAAINEENIGEHLRAAAALRPQSGVSQIFQIDDGFTPEMGDWLEVKPQFPRGMKPILDEIRAAGFVPGLWIAPFLVGNRSHLYQQHPEWTVKERSSGNPLVGMRFYGEFRWHKRSEEYYVLDATHPDALAYLREVFRTWRHNWGCEYFKTDFMFYGAHYGPETARYHTPGLTRIETWRLVAKMIRDEIGDALWIGCGCPLWASVGYVDAVRIGRDVGVHWEGDGSAQSLIHDGMNRNFANHILWQADPDSILLRTKYHHLSAVEVKSLAIYAGMMGGVMTTSDNLAELTAERAALWKLVRPETKITCQFPWLGQAQIHYTIQPGNPPRLLPVPADLLIAQIRPFSEGAVVHLFNSGEIPVERELAWISLGLPAVCYAWSSENAAPPKAPTSYYHVSLEAHASLLLWVTRSPLAVQPDRLP